METYVETYVDTYVDTFVDSCFSILALFPVRPNSSSTACLVGALRKGATSSNFGVLIQQ